MGKGKIQLPLQTFSLVIGFIVWVLLSSLLPFIKENIPLSAGQTAWVTAVPVLLGSILRVPIGYYTNRFGARIVFITSFIVLILPVFYLSRANTVLDLILSGLLLGIGGAIFSAGVTSLPKYFPKERHGFVNGIYGVGNIGTAVTSFTAPVIARQFGWQATVQMTIGLLVLFAVLVAVLGDRKEPRSKVQLTAQIRSVYGNQKLWLLSFFYFITFGSFVAFTVYLPNFLVTHFGLDKVDAGLRTAGFIVLCTMVRPVGGWLADKFNTFLVLLFVFGGLTFAGVILSFSLGIGLYTFGSLLVAFCAGIGNGAVFKLVPLYFTREAGIVNGIVAAFGGLGGFFPPLVLTLVSNLTGQYSIGFMALSESALASFILTVWMYYQDQLKLATNIISHTGEGILVTDTNGVIRMVNPSFTALTGFEAEEAVGKTPRILRSERQSEQFYNRMWEEIRSHGFWQGEIWNKKKNGELFLEWLTISAVKNDAGEVKYYAGMFSDITNSAR